MTESRLAIFVVIGLVMLGLGALAGWAVSRVFGEPAPVVVEADHTHVEVGTGEVSATVSLGGRAEWEVETVGSNRAVGTVTAVAVDPGEEVDTGHLLYRVDERPVLIARGDIPAFRAMSRGTNGGDVAQLQQLLIDLGYYTGPLDGVFGASVQSAVRSWQRVVGATVDGVVELGEVIFVPTLPIKIVVDQNVVAVGRILTGGEPVIGALPSTPTFSAIVTSSSQIALLPSGTEVTITGTLDDRTVRWSAVAGLPGITGSPATGGNQVVFLEPSGTGAICRDECGLVALGFGASLEVTIVTVPHTSGVVVPVGALVTAANGQLGVIDDTGALIPVTIVASARGMAVVEGVDEGTRVRVPGGP